MTAFKHPDGLQVLIALDQLANTLLAGFADETISSRAYRAFVDGKTRWPMRLIDALFFWQEAHCKESYLSELARTQLPPEMR